MSSTRATIVIVEDDASMSSAIERLLDAAGWEHVAFSSAEALLEANVADQANGFVFDVHLPGISGFELRQCLLAKGGDAPVLFITARDQASSRAEAERFGAIGFFIKPFSGERLLETLKNHCAVA